MKRFPLILLLIATSALGAPTKLRLETQTQGILPSANGGTGINNSTRTLTLSTNSGTIAFPSASTTQTFPTTSQTLTGLTEAQTLTNKRITKRQLNLVAPGANPVINTDNYDVIHMTGLAANILSMTGSLSGTPVAGDRLNIDFTDDGTARTITWGTGFESSPGETLPAATVASTRLDVIFLWNEATSKWRCVGSSDVSNAGASNIAYGPTWNGVTLIAPAKDALYDYLHLSDTDDNGKTNVLDISTAGVVTSTAGGVVGSVAPGTPGNVLTSNVSGTLWVSSTPAVSTPTGTGFYRTTTGVMDAAAIPETGTGNVARATSPHMTNVFIDQATNGTTAIYGNRATDSSPTGSWIGLWNQANNSKILGFTIAGVMDAGSVPEARITWSDPGTNTIKMWNDSTNLLVDSTIGAGLSFDTGSNTLSANVDVNNTATLTNKTITKRVLDSSAPSSPVTPSSDSYDGIIYRGITAPLTLNAPSGTPTQMQPLMFRFVDTGTGRALTWTTGANGFRAIVVPFPTTTVANKTTYVLVVWNGTDSRWDSLATGTEP